MATIDPLYIAYKEKDATRGTNWLYLDTQVVNALRKSESETYSRLRKIINNQTYQLCYSSAHLSDYLRDDTHHKNDDLNFMAEIGMVNWLAYDEQIRRCNILRRSPIDTFYQGRISNDQAKVTYQKLRKPGLDRQLLQLYEWFKNTLIKFEEDPSYLDRIDKKEAQTFQELQKQVHVNSSSLSPEKFIEEVDLFWTEQTNSLTDKEFSRFLMSTSAIAGDELQYGNEKFDLSQPNLIPQIANTHFKKEFERLVHDIVQSYGGYDELMMFTTTYGVLQALGVGPDKAKKYNAYSNRNDAGHCYFASMCNYLITEDNGLYRRAKIMYGALGVTTKVFKIEEFINR